jgi:hypothetical protein
MHLERDEGWRVGKHFLPLVLVEIGVGVGRAYQGVDTRLGQLAWFTPWPARN